MFNDFFSRDFSYQKFVSAIEEITIHDLPYFILKHLLHYDMAYQAEMMTEEDAKFMAMNFIGMFEKDARFYSNSTWNKNEYSGGNVELGLSGLMT
ncbi:MAG TPA: hypothetical protein VD905_21325 [Flavobacteriales bacterium]|nr:hypothetical protein [Flavobacteriales bacterium]